LGEARVRIEAISISLMSTSQGEVQYVIVPSMLPKLEST
jgi:hypothetical protein